MSLTDLGGLAAVAGLVIVAGLLSSVDAALGNFSKARAEDCLADGKPGARSLVQVASDHAPYVATLLLLRIAVEVAAVVLATRWVFQRWDADGAVTGLLIVVVALVWFAAIDVSPRTVGRRHSERIALWAAPVTVWLDKVLGPLPALLILLSNMFTPGRGFAEGPFSSEVELREAVDLAEASDLIEDGERKMIHSVFELGDTVAREVMVPRPDVVYLERNKKLRQAMSLFLRSGFSRIPVTGDNLDDVVGVLYFKDVAKRDFDEPGAELIMRIEEVMRPAHFVPDTKPVDELLTQMQATREHLVIVVDEYGGTAGLLTIEDILEEIVGEIVDEYDVSPTEAELVEPGTWRVSSRFAVDDLADLVGRSVEHEDVDSVLGLMAQQMGKVPLPGAVVECQRLRFEAERVAGRRNQVQTVLISVSDTPA